MPTTTINAGESAKTITLNEGEQLTLSGSDAAAGVAYLLDQVAGGSNSVRSWIVGPGSLPPIGPFSGTQRVRISCSVGMVTATTGSGLLNIPRVIAQSAVPVIIVPSGSVAADGTITLGTALNVVYAGAWIKLPAGAIVGGAAGLYYCTFSSTTVGSVKDLFVNPAVSPFVSYIPVGPLTAAVGSGAYTQSLSITQLCNVTVPGGAMGPNGVFRSEVIFGSSNTANNKAYYAGMTPGNLFVGLNISGAGATGTCGRVRLANRGSQNSQTYFAGGWGYGPVQLPQLQRSFDMTVDQPFFYSAALTNAADYVVLEGFTAEILPG
ncbi:hypothetical protein GTP38_11355 [Duganella sp. FT94W]|uniref:Uncharacterized protein n=1 Tax=Duganella lactea TaxID=2692173 RepID=A0ABW9V5S5_9BURK|nr:hypothetical protein [Duganella lactea]MYM34933.1 hypothetical protein [Duganella lactea]